VALLSLLTALLTLIENIGGDWSDLVSLMGPAKSGNSATLSPSSKWIEPDASRNAGRIAFLSPKPDTIFRHRWDRSVRYSGTVDMRHGLHLWFFTWTLLSDDDERRRYVGIPAAETAGRWSVHVKYRKKEKGPNSVTALACISADLARELKRESEEDQFPTGEHFFHVPNPGSVRIKAPLLKIKRDGLSFEGSWLGRIRLTTLPDVPSTLRGLLRP
jgi:hypothetical protein